MYRSSRYTLYLRKWYWGCSFNWGFYSFWQDCENDKRTENRHDNSGKRSSQLRYYHRFHYAHHDCGSHYCVVSFDSSVQKQDINHHRAAYLRKNHPGWINVPTLIVDCVSVAVAFIPEGLPIALTASLTITANLMRKNKILCKSLKTVETLGAVSVICSDKTGTLTKVLPLNVSNAQF